MLFGNVDKGQRFSNGGYDYIKIEVVVDYDNANRKYNAVIINANDMNPISNIGNATYFLDDDEVQVSF